MADYRETNNAAQDALNRLARADKRRTGCHLSAEMIEGLSRTYFAEIWSQEDPRTGKRYGA
jgi:hypothetical protein